MKKILILFLVTTLAISCKKKEPKNDATKEPVEVVVETPTTLIQIGCYEYNKDGNQILFEITEINTTVEGTINYALAEKDANTGTFSGTLTDNKLIGIYTFSSEGTESTREVAFMVKNGQLIEGFGELNETGNAFKNKNNISYTSTMPLTKTDCTK
ncbi:hypothetical protein SAMN05444344_0516 [Tenacibaculum mesophilum]|uniref:Uncharacterized protein n=1 Tax=Tenacibaculum mesophilum TaxID=104268 RepID=A0ABM7CIM7_9FLAO|nr:hypothetical protein [Tenacibaculum mesophilum]AZJ33669.1 hypothetical protein D6200_14265 [Tenacibaculum mesophilum]QFS28910.1 hypothetical protein F9Y86_11075 [Tenacibaculum mesophilum]SHF56141.1 hypothetical protein SAMN05444344_0516 [Tenacibaculum mesophilum]